jgi:nicotinate-nucleotide adenylyltransferase
MRGRIGVLGGTFDPIHQGHLDLGTAAHDVLDLDEVLVVPSNVPPHRPQPAASSHHRFAMAALAATGLPGWRLSDIELEDAGRSYTSLTLRRLHEQGVPAANLVFIIGADAFSEIEAWHDYPAIFDLAHFAVVSRPGHPVDRLPALVPSLASRMVVAGKGATEARPVIFLIDRTTADVSSTAIRERLARGESIAGLVPERVRQYVEQQHLYTNSLRRGERSGSGHDVAAGRLHDQD